MKQNDLIKSDFAFKLKKNKINKQQVMMLDEEIQRFIDEKNKDQNQRITQQNTTQNIFICINPYCTKDSFKKISESKKNQNHKNSKNHFVIEYEKYKQIQSSFQNLKKDDQQYYKHKKNQIEKVMNQQKNMMIEMIDQSINQIVSIQKLKRTFCYQVAKYQKQKQAISNEVIKKIMTLCKQVDYEYTIKIINNFNTNMRNFSQINNKVAFHSFLMQLKHKQLELSKNNTEIRSNSNENYLCGLFNHPLTNQQPQRIIKIHIDPSKEKEGVQFLFGMVTLEVAIKNNFTKLFGFEKATCAYGYPALKKCIIFSQYSKLTSNILQKCFKNEIMISINLLGNQVHFSTIEKQQSMKLIYNQIAIVSVESNNTYYPFIGIKGYGSVQIIQNLLQ